MASTSSVQERPAVTPVTGQRLSLNTKWRMIKKDRALYLLLVPGILYFLVFRYWPMYGFLIAFKNFSVAKGILGSPWAGLKHFRFFLESPNAWEIIRNTLLINFYTILFAFPAPIILASLFNELRNVTFKRVAQTVSYLPHFISTVVICGMVVNFLSPSDGIINQILVNFFGLDEPIFFLSRPEMFRGIYVATEIWQNTGWGTILYLAALAGINPELYEASRIDGANRWQQYWRITFSHLVPVISVVVIINIGQIMLLGPEKILLLYNPLVYETADIIETFVYRRGILQADYSYATAVSLFQAFIGFTLMMGANKLSKWTSDSGLW